VASDVGRFGSGDQGSRHGEKREEKCYGQQELDLDRLPKWGHRVHSHHVASFNQDLANTPDEEPQQVSVFSDHHSLCKGRRRRGRS
jgi:hypothetical protein